MVPDICSTQRCTSKQTFTVYIALRFFDSVRWATVWFWFPVFGAILLMNAQPIGAKGMAKVARSEKLLRLVTLFEAESLPNDVDIQGLRRRAPPKTEDLLYSRDCLYDLHALTGQDGKLLCLF